MGYFGLRDLGKFKKYQRKLGSVASGFQVHGSNYIDVAVKLTTTDYYNQSEVNINGVLLDIIKNRAQHQIEHDSDEGEGEDNETSEETAESGRAAEQEALAESFRKGNTKVTSN